MGNYVFGKQVGMDHGKARERVIEALGKEGFGVLTEIDVSATLKKKLGVDTPAYNILGACNPQFAHRAMQAALVTDEVALFCRSGTAGAQRFPCHWVGDTPSTWDGLVTALRACLSLSLSGFDAALFAALDAVVRQYERGGDTAEIHGSVCGALCVQRPEDIDLLRLLDAGVPAKSIIYQFSRGDQQANNPGTAALLRAGDLASWSVHYRHDLAVSEDPAVPKNPHQALRSPLHANPTFRSVARAMQDQLAAFIASGGTLIVQPEPARFFEVPVAASDLEQLHYIP